MVHRYFHQAKPYARYVHLEAAAVVTDFIRKKAYLFVGCFLRKIEAKMAKENKLKKYVP